MTRNMMMEMGMMGMCMCVKTCPILFFRKGTEWQNTL